MRISLTVTGESLAALRARALAIARRIGDARRPAMARRSPPTPSAETPAEHPPGRPHGSAA